MALRELGMGLVHTEMCSAGKIHTRFQRVGIGLAKKLVWVFLTQLRMTPSELFGQLVTKQNKLKRVSKISITILKPRLHIKMTIFWIGGVKI